MRGRFFNVVDLVNKLESETRAGKQGRMADYLSRLDFVLLDELGYLPFAQAGGQLHHMRFYATLHDGIAVLVKFDARLGLPRGFSELQIQVPSHTKPSVIWIGFRRPWIR